MMHKLPYEISNYIRKHFYEGYLSTVDLEKSKDGGKFFKIVLHENGVLHYLKFREDGTLLEHEKEVLYEEYYYH